MELDPTHSQAEFSVRHMFTKVRGHMVVTSGIVETDDLDPLKTVITGEPRPCHGQHRSICPRRSPSQRRFFRHPTLSGDRLRSTAISQTLKTTTPSTACSRCAASRRAVTLYAQAAGDASIRSATDGRVSAARTTLNRKDFGLNWNRALESGGLLVGDEIEINLEIESRAGPGRTRRGRLMQTVHQRGPEADAYARVTFPSSPRPYRPDGRCHRRPRLLLSRQSPAAAPGGSYLQTNIVSDVKGTAPVTDPKLINPWGIVAGPGTPFWIADNNGGVSTLYTGTGAPFAWGTRCGHHPGSGWQRRPRRRGCTDRRRLQWIVGLRRSSGCVVRAEPLSLPTEDGTIAGWSPAAKRGSRDSRGRPLRRGCGL